MQEILRSLEELCDKLLSKKRRSHVKSCMHFASELAEIHGVDVDRVKIASLAHDAFRDLKPSILLKMAIAYRIRITDLERLNPILLHGKIAAEYLRRRFNLTDREILQAVAYHTTGKEGLGKIGMILFLADSLEENRVYDDVERLRKIARENLDEALFMVAENKIRYALTRRLLLMPETVKMWNWLIKLRKDDKNWN
ncbi:MAG: bis(5'-nucleosyl)-tetraphosphatase (symmetrical) YqeK [Pseudothermotoga sp.]